MRHAQVDKAGELSSKHIILNLFIMEGDDFTDDSSQGDGGDDSSQGDGGQQGDQEELVKQMKEELDEAKSELEKLKNKQYNFKKLEKKAKSKEDEAKSKEGALDKAEKRMEQMEQDLITRQRKWEEAQLSKDRDEILDKLSDGNRELKDKIEIEAKDLNMDASDKDSIKSKYQKAYYIVKGLSDREVNPINSINVNTAWEKGKKKSFSDTDKGKNVLNKVGRNQVKWDKIPKRGAGSYFD